MMSTGKARGIGLRFRRVWAARLLAVAATAGPFGAVTAAAATESPITAYESSGGRRTDRYAETVAYCRWLAASSPYLSYTTFGASAQGRALPLLVADAHGAATPGSVRRDPAKVVVLLQACIHAGETCGKDAGLLLLRDAVAAGEKPGWLAAVTLLFVPIFNPDGHERFGPYNRINQNGPEEMGWRVTADNLNLNRDYLKADTKEMRSWLHLWNAWLPDFFVDTHATDGADYQYPLTYAMATGGSLDAGLTRWCETYLAAMNEHMAAADLPIAPYVAFVERHDPRSGLVFWSAGPRYSQGYVAQQNRPGLLIEAHMLKPYAVRVEATKVLLEASLAWLADGGAGLRALVQAADAHAASAAFRAEAFPLRFTPTGETEPFRFAGVAYERVTSRITGGDWYRYHSDQPVTFELEFQRRLEPSVTATLPEAYLIPPEWDEVIARLQAHGVAVRFLREPQELAVRTYRFHDAEWRQQPFEGRHLLTCTAEPWRETRPFPLGTAVVDLQQRAARVAIHALEPDGPDSFLRWGFFDPIFTRVEYVEAHVIEPLIERMLAEDEELAARFAAKQAAEPAFAADPWAIRTWFYQQTPYYDQRVGIYPVGMIDDAELARELGR